MPNLQTLAQQILLHGPHKQESTPRRIRALFDSVFLFDTTSASLVWEHQYYPQYYIQASKFRAGTLKKGGAVEGEKKGVFWATVKGNQRETGQVLWFEQGPLAGLVRVEFGAVGVSPRCVWR